MDIQWGVILGMSYLHNSAQAHPPNRKKTVLKAHRKTEKKDAISADTHPKTG
jgi:hypothetical protein